MVAGASDGDFGEVRTDGLILAPMNGGISACRTGFIVDLLIDVFLKATDEPFSFDGLLPRLFGDQVAKRLTQYQPVTA